MFKYVVTSNESVTPAVALFIIPIRVILKLYPSFNEPEKASVMEIYLFGWSMVQEGEPIFVDVVQAKAVAFILIWEGYTTRMLPVVSKALATVIDIVRSVYIPEYGTVLVMLAG